jgi:hypothetical protein
MTTTRHGIHLDNDLPVHMSYLDKITFSVDEDGEANGSVIQLLRTGSWNHPKYGRIQITEKTLDNLKRHFDENIRGVDLAIDTEHKAERGAKGWIKDVFIDETGSRLYGEVDWTPAGREMIKNGEYKYISAEYSPLYTDTETGHTFKDVLVGGALTNRPFIKDMEPVLLSEDIMEEVLEELEVSADEDYFEKGGNANLYYNPESIHFSEVAKSEKD